MFITLLMFGVIGVRVSATNTNVVSIYVDGNTRTISTSANNVAEVLDRAEIDLDEADLVVPSLDTVFTSAVFNVNVYRAKPFYIVDGEETKWVKSPYMSPRLVVEKSAGVKVYEEDEYTVEAIKDLSLGIGFRLTIDRALPVQIIVDGNTLDMRTQQETVAGLLVEKGIVLGEEDKLNMDLSTQLEENDRIVITRVGMEIVANEELVPFTTLVTYDDTQNVGYEKITQKGKNGRKLVTYEVEKHDGEEVSRTILQVVNHESPLSQKVIRGTKTTNDVWAALRRCESGGNYANKNNPKYRGAYQFDQSTWDSNAPSGYAGVDPADAPPHIQDQAAQNLQSRRGWGPWPACASSLGLL